MNKIDEREMNEIVAEIVEGYGLTPEVASSYRQYCEDYGRKPSMEHFDDVYEGIFNSPAEFAEHIVEALCGDELKYLPTWVKFDWKETARQLSFHYDFYSCSDETTPPKPKPYDCYNLVAVFKKT